MICLGCFRLCKLSRLVRLRFSCIRRASLAGQSLGNINLFGQLFLSDVSCFYICCTFLYVHMFYVYIPVQEHT